MNCYSYVHVNTPRLFHRTTPVPKRHILHTHSILQILCMFLCICNHHLDMCCTHALPGCTLQLLYRYTFTRTYVTSCEQHMRIWKPQHTDRSGMSVSRFTIDRCWNFVFSGPECMVLHSWWVWSPTVPIATWESMTAMVKSTLPPSLPPALPTPPNPTLLEPALSTFLAASATLVTTPSGQRNARYHVPPVSKTFTIPNKCMPNWWLHVQWILISTLAKTQVVPIHYARDNDYAYILVFMQFHWCNWIKLPGGVPCVEVIWYSWGVYYEHFVVNLEKWNRSWIFEE